jgi:hypothetical protein
MHLGHFSLCSDTQVPNMVYCVFIQLRAPAIVL